jgi:small subunit ribosomal protein S20
MRHMRTLSSEGDTEKIGTTLVQTMSVIDVGLKRGVLHRNTAARYKSRMARQAKAGLAQAEA